MDRVLQLWRQRLARPWVPKGARVLDIGCHKGEFLRDLRTHIGPSVGVDPLARPFAGPRLCLWAEVFRRPSPLPNDSFDVVMLMATLEHMHEKDGVAAECFRLLRPGGRIILTVPSPRVDTVSAVLRRFRLLGGIALDQHHGYDPRDVPALFKRHGFVIQHWQPFQLGLNNLFVFSKPSFQEGP